MANVGIALPGIATQGQVKWFAALMDTGATCTCIAASAAKAIGVHPVGKQPMVSATGAEPVNQYIVDLLLPFNPPIVLSSLQMLELAIQSPYQMLLGRDVLCRGVFTMNFNGTYTFCI